MKRALLLLVCCWPLLAFSETVWVNDIIYLGIRPQIDGGKPVAVVKSGTVLEVLERAGRNLRVRTPDGVEGWVSATYVSDEMPARQKLAGLEESNNKLKGDLERINGEMKKVNEANTTLSSNLMDVTQERDQLQQKIETLNQQIDALRPRPDEAVKAQLKLLYWIGGAIAALLFAFAIGAAWYRSRVTKRLGGLRI